MGLTFRFGLVFRLAELYSGGIPSSSASLPLLLYLLSLSSPPLLPPQPISTPFLPDQPLSSPPLPTQPLSSPNLPIQPVSSPILPIQPVSSPPPLPTQPLSSLSLPIQPLSCPPVLPTQVSGYLLLFSCASSVCQAAPPVVAILINILLIFPMPSIVGDINNSGHLGAESGRSARPGCLIDARLVNRWRWGGGLLCHLR